MTNPSKAKGTAAETAAVRYLNNNGWPGAERAALHGNHDHGDITGTPGLCFEIKAGKQAEQAVDYLIGLWLDQTEKERLNSHAEAGILVTKRAGHGTSRVGDWWAWVTVDTLVYIVTNERYSMDPDYYYEIGTVESAPIRMKLDDLIAILRTKGYGTPLQERNP